MPQRSQSGRMVSIAGVYVCGETSESQYWNGEPTGLAWGWEMPMMLLTIALMFAGAPAERPSSLCDVAHVPDSIRVRLSPPSVTYRVHPSPRQIVERGEGSGLRRISPVWRRFSERLCTARPRDVSVERHPYLPSIVIFAQGEEDRALLTIEYPDALSGDTEVRAEFDGKPIWLPVSHVRYLLDYAVPDSRSS